MTGGCLADDGEQLTFAVGVQNARRLWGSRAMLNIAAGGAKVSCWLHAPTHPGAGWATASLGCGRRQEMAETPFVDVDEMWPRTAPDDVGLSPVAG